MHLIMPLELTKMLSTCEVEKVVMAICDELHTLHVTSFAVGYIDVVVGAVERCRDLVKLFTFSKQCI